MKHLLLLAVHCRFPSHRHIRHRYYFIQTTWFHWILRWRLIQRYHRTIET